MWSLCTLSLTVTVIKDERSRVTKESTVAQVVSGYTYGDSVLMCLMLYNMKTRDDFPCMTLAWTINDLMLSAGVRQA